MRAVPVVVVQPGGKVGFAFGGGVVGRSVGPFSEMSLDESLGLAVRPGPVRPGEAVAEAELITGLAEGFGTVAAAVIGQHALKADAERLVILDSSQEESHGREMALIGQNLRESEPGMIVDGDVQELPARAAGAMAPIAVNAVTHAADAA